MIRGVIISPSNCVRRICYVASHLCLKRPGTTSAAWNSVCYRPNSSRVRASAERVGQTLAACSGRCCCCSRWFQSKRDLIRRNILVLTKLLTKQCEFVAAQRLRRLHQIWCFYCQLYSDVTLKRMVSKLGRRLAQQRPLGVLLGTALFNWEKENITDEDLERCACDLVEIESFLGKELPQGKNRIKAANCESQDVKSWELVINKDHLKVWRKAVENTYLYEYKVFGTYYDIPARAFFRVQVDTDYRKTWDKMVIKLDIVDRHKADAKTESEVVHWVMHYPYPMYSRDYVYVRRYMVDDDNKLMVFVSRSTEHPEVPVHSSYVRVHTYKSQMVIRPHDSFDDNGFDYVLTYFDDPHAIFPGPAYNWMAASGVPDFVKKLHNAAKALVAMDEEKQNKIMSKESLSASKENSKESLKGGSHESLKGGSKESLKPSKESLKVSKESLEDSESMKGSKECLGPTKKKRKWRFRILP